MSAYTIQIKGVHPAQNDLTHDHAGETAEAIVKHLESQGHTVHHCSVNHGNLKGGTYDHLETKRIAKEKAAAENTQADTKFAAAD